MGGKPLFSPPSPFPPPGCLRGAGWGGVGYWEATPPSSWFWPLGLPHPACVSTIFALYNRPLYIIKPPSPDLRPCAWRGGRGSVHGSCFQGRWGSACQSQAQSQTQRALGTRPASIIFLGEEVEGWAPWPWCPQRKSSHRRGEGSASQPLAWGSAGHPGGPWDSSPMLTSTQLCGVQAWPAGAELPSPGLAPGLTLGTAHCLHWAHGDGRAALPARRLRGPRSWGKSPRAVSWGKGGLARGGKMQKPQPLSSPLLPWIRQGEDQTKGLDPSWPRNRAVPAPQPRPGGLSLPTVRGAAALSPGTNATKPEWNRSNKQGLWQRERELLNPAWQLIKELIRRQGVRGDQGRAAC